MSNAFPTAGRLTPPSLAAWHALPPADAAAAVLACNGSEEWARLLTNDRPFSSVEDLHATADRIWRDLPAEHWQQAFESHPRIGETHARAASAESIRWSGGEQTASQTDAEMQAALAAANAMYEARFGRIFLVCATGKSAAEILALLQRRMTNTPEAELLEAAEQQRRITQLRLRKWLGLPAAACDDV